MTCDGGWAHVKSQDVKRIVLGSLFAGPGWIAPNTLGARSHRGIREAEQVSIACSSFSFNSACGSNTLPYTPAPDVADVAAQLHSFLSASDRPRPLLECHPQLRTAWEAIPRAPQQDPNLVTTAVMQLLHIHMNASAQMMSDGLEAHEQPAEQMLSPNFMAGQFDSVRFAPNKSGGISCVNLLDNVTRKEMGDGKITPCGDNAGSALWLWLHALMQATGIECGGTQLS